MSGALKTIGKIAGVVAAIALVATPFAPAGFAILGASLASIASVAAVASTVAMMGSQMLAKPPNAKGQVNERVTGANNPLPYMMGRSYSGGIMVHDTGYGGTVSKVDNPYRFMAVVYSCCGPIEAMESVQYDFSPVSLSGTAASGYYSGFLWVDSQLGARPEADALAPNFAGTPEWGPSYKLSGFAALGHSLKFDKDGKKFAGGSLPVIGAIWKGVKVYDPRLDSTVPGGSGSQRITNEATWTYSRNPALHALAYAYGRYVNDKKVFGVDLGGAAIDLASTIAWANVCDTNTWYVNGTIYEPDDKWNNLKRICEAGGAMPVLAAGILSFSFQAPRTSLYTIGRDDLASGNISAKLSKGWKTRQNTMVPRYRSEAHQWSYVQAGEVNVPAWVTDDGEIKSDERQWDLVTNVDHVTELATYDLYQRREAGPITLTCKSHMRAFTPGDCVTLAAELGVHPDGALKAIIRRKTINPASGEVTLDLEQETDAKHTAALSATGSAPATVPIPSSEDLDNAYDQNNAVDGYATQLISLSFPINITITGTDAGSDATISVSSHTRVYSDKVAAIDATTVTGLDFAKTYYIYYDDSGRAGGAVTMQATQTQGDAFASPANPARHYVGLIITPANGAADTPGYPAVPPYYYNGP